MGFSIRAASLEAQAHAQLHLLNKHSGGFQKLALEKKLSQISTLNANNHQADYTLKNLLINYCDHQKTIGKSSYKDAMSVFKVHVFESWEKIAQMPAKQITTEQIADMLRLAHEKGLLRTSNKLRSYLRSAYQVAQSSKTKASIPSLFKNFGIVINPVIDTQPDTNANKSDKNPLTDSELFAYWKIIKDLPGLKGAALQIHLLTGGQRIQQLVKLESTKKSNNSITLIDTKGRAGSEPRSYTTPLVKTAQEAMKHCQSSGFYVFSSDDGKTHIANTTLSNWAKESVGSSIKNFSAKRIRSGVETFLAKNKFSKDLRGRLQSHGISGVQDRHYDGHDYLEEKLEMLEVLESALQSVN